MNNISIETVDVHYADKMQWHLMWKLGSGCVYSGVQLSLRCENEQTVSYAKREAMINLY